MQRMDGQDEITIKEWIKVQIDAQEKVAAHQKTLIDEAERRARAVSTNLEEQTAEIRRNYEAIRRERESQTTKGEELATREAVVSARAEQLEQLKRDLDDQTRLLAEQRQDLVAGETHDETFCPVAEIHQLAQHAVGQPFYLNDRFPDLFYPANLFYAYGIHIFCFILSVNACRIIGKV